MSAGRSAPARRNPRWRVILAVLQDWLETWRPARRRTRFTEPPFTDATGWRMSGELTFAQVLQEAHFDPAKRSCRRSCCIRSAARHVTPAHAHIQLIFTG